MHNDYLLAPDKIEIKKEMLSNYQLNIANFYDIPIDNVKKLVLIFINEEMQLLHFENLKLYLSLGLKFEVYRI